MELKQQLKLGQQLVMTPQLQLAIRLLQYSRLELAEELRREVDQNPVLGEEEPAMSARSPEDRERASGASELAPGALKAIDWDQLVENRNQVRGGLGGGGEDAPGLDQTLTRKESLADHLRWQLGLSDFTEEERAFAEVVIANLDDNGFLVLGTDDETVAGLERDYLSDPTNAYVALNLGVLYADGNDTKRAQAYLKRFCGLDIGDDVRANAVETLELVDAADGELRRIADALQLKIETAPDKQGVLRAVMTAARAGAPGAFHDLENFALAHDVDASTLRQMRHVLRSRPPLRAEGLALPVADAAYAALADNRFRDARTALMRLVAQDLEIHEREQSLSALRALEQEPVRHSEPPEGDDPDAALAMIAERVGLDPEDAPEVLRAMQQWDPVGVCARDVRECLLAQAEAFSYGDLEKTILRDHMASLERRRYDLIAKALGVPLEDIEDAVRDIRELNSRPARDYVEVDERGVMAVPDVFVTREGDKWVVTDNPSGTERVGINTKLAESLMKNPELKDYVAEKLRDAQWLVRALEQRRRSIVRVTEAIVQRQTAFFDIGPEHLKPMVLRDIAEVVGMHESTVSRVTSQKYVSTPFGLVELKKFFTAAVKGHGDEDMTTEKVKRELKKLLDGEDPASPLSDQSLTEKLHEALGVGLARRTVAKYREAMGYASSSARKRSL